MGLVNEEDVVPLHPLAEKPLQLRVGVKDIVVVADDCVRPQGQVQTQLEGAHLPFLRLLLHRLTAHVVGGGDHVIDRIVDTVKMSLGVRTVVRIALRLLAEAYLLLCRQGDDLVLESRIPLLHCSGPIRAGLLQYVKGLLGHGSGDGLGGQVKKLVRQPLPHCLHSRKDGGHGLSHTCGSLDEQLFLSLNGPVDSGRQLLLALPVLVGKFYFFYRSVPLLPPLHLEESPLFVGVRDTVKPLSQLLYGILLPEPADLLCLQMTVGHLHAHLLLLMLIPVDKGIAFGLGQVHRYRLLQGVHIPEYPLDLVDDQPLLRVHDAVRPPLHLEDELLVGHLAFHGHLRRVHTPHLPLDLPVEPGSHLHGLLVRRGSSIVKIPALEDELHQGPDRNFDQLLFHRSIISGDVILFNNVASEIKPTGGILCITRKYYLII